MKTHYLFVVAVVLLSTAFMVNTSFTYAPAYSPVFMTREDLDKSVMYHADGRVLKQPGKIYYKAPYLFINEKYKGVHVFNNTNPAQPVNEGFITAPGCIDLAVKGNILYMDCAVDLVAFDLISKRETKRIINVFPEPAAPGNSFYGNPGKPSENMILVGWKKNNETKKN